MTSCLTSKVQTTVLFLKYINYIKKKIIFHEYDQHLSNVFLGVMRDFEIASGYLIFTVKL